MQPSAVSPLHINNNARGIIQIDLNGIITGYDSLAQKLLNVPKEKVLYRHFSDSFSDEYFGFSMKKALAKRLIPSTLNAPSPTLNFIEVEALFISQESPLPTVQTLGNGVMIILRSMNELERCKVIAARNDHLKELDKMAALVAHEIRNPLGGIIGFASLLQRDLKSQPELYKLATRILDGTESLKRLINHMLSFTIPLPLDLKPRNLVSLLDELLLYLRADESIGPGINITLEKAAESIVSLVDTDNLKSALLNLTTNASQAMPKGGDIRIKISETENEAVIELSDTGVGISKENAPKIFSPFFTTRPEGHGFGLMEVHKIIHEHHGEIEFFSTPGKGTTFLIYLPKVPRNSEAASIKNIPVLTA
jgi:signal transduction histidine kinase